MQVRSINYSLHFESVKIHKDCLYWKVFSPDIYRKIFFQQFAAFFSYICWSVSCISWVSKFKKFFLTCTKTETWCIFEGFNIVLYGKFIFSSSILFSRFYLVCKLFKGLFQPLSQSVNCMNWVFETWSISRRCPET